MRIWLQHILSNFLIQIYLYDSLALLSLLVATDYLFKELQFLTVEGFYLFYSFAGLFLASPTVSNHLTGYPENYSSFLFPSLWYQMGWVEYDNETVDSFF